MFRNQREDEKAIDEKSKKITEYKQTSIGLIGAPLRKDVTVT